VAQSVELLLDERAEAAVRRQWDQLAEAGLPSERRSGTPEHHRPHLTLYAANAFAARVESALTDVAGDLDLQVQLGPLMIFGPRRGQFILVRSVTASAELLRLQARVAEVCHADPTGQFGPGRWSPHVTLARRVPVDRAGTVLAALDRTADRSVSTRITQCRRWDGRARTAWLL
jgi:2'-5' RNA ligase